MALEAAATQALRIFPLHDVVRTTDATGVTTVACSCAMGADCRNIGKHPLVSWRNYEGNDRGMGGGYGIEMGPFNNVFVTDLDVRPAKDGKPARDGIAAFLALAALHGGEIPDTLSVLTPSGGVHLYWRLPPGLYIPTTHSEIADGVDVQCEPGYVVGPGSSHKNGGVYEEVPGPLADCPAWLLALIVKDPTARLVLSATEHRTVDPSSPEGVRAVAWSKQYLLTRAEPAIEGQDGSGRFLGVACHLMYSALPLETLHDLVEEFYNHRCVGPWSPKEIDHKLVDADKRMMEPRGLCSPGFSDAMHGRTKDTDARTPSPLHEYTFEPGMRSEAETSKASFGEIVGDLYDHIDWAGVLMYDTFKDQISAVDPPSKLDAETSAGLSDNDIHIIRCWFEYHGKKINKEDIQAAVEVVAHRQAFNSIQDWLRSLSWDGVKRLERVLPEYFQTRDGPYERAIGKRWFIALVARAMEPGCQSDCTLILEGPQGYGKTSAFRALMHEPHWYADSTSGVDDKDFKQNLLGIWLMGFDELDSLAKGSLTKVKTELTVTRDHYRKSYGRRPGGYPRACVFCGSTNAKKYLNDSSGGRRFWPCEILRPIDIARIRAVHEQLFAEAYVLYRAGEPWYANTPEVVGLCEEEQEARLEIHPWEDRIRDWLHDPTRVSWEPIAKVEGSMYGGGLQAFDASKGVTAGDVLKHAVGKLEGQWNPGDAQTIGRIMIRLGLRHVRVRNGRALSWRYVFPDAVLAEMREEIRLRRETSNKR
jgi:predicted P-loop ATPase